MIEFNTQKGRRTGEVVKENKKTVLVRLPIGKVIKRHLIKHNVQVVF